MIPNIWIEPDKDTERCWHPFGMHLGSWSPAFRELFPGCRFAQSGANSFKAFGLDVAESLRDPGCRYAQSGTNGFEAFGLDSGHLVKPKAFQEIGKGLSTATPLDLHRTNT